MFLKPKQEQRPGLRLAWIGTGILILFLLSGLALAACTPASPSPVDGGVQKAVNETAAVPDENTPAVIAARRFLASKLGVKQSQLKFISVEAVAWNDACLELGRANERCNKVVTPGYLVKMEMSGVIHRLHTSATGQVVRVEE